MTPSSAAHLDVLHDRYELLREIGDGAQATTYLGRDRDRDVRVTVKELDATHTETWRAIELFERERNTLAALDHSGIPRYVDGFHLDGRDGPRFFMVCDYLEGRTLRERIMEGEGMTETEVRAMLEDVLDVLRYLHGRSPPVLHRDVKPANVLERTDGPYTLIDFGTVEAAMAGGAESTAVGTMGYAAPEQMRGEGEPASDLYGLGATALTMLTTREGEGPAAGTRVRLDQHLDVPDDLERLLDRMLADDVEARPASAASALSELDDGG